MFFAREAWPSPATGTTLTDGDLRGEETLTLTSRMNDAGVIFGDGIEADRIGFDWGQRVEVRVADVRLNLFK